jgi:WD40 repeat protein
VRLWNPSAGRLLRTLEGHSAKVRSVAWRPDGQVLASASEDGTVRLWEPSSGRLLRALEIHSDLLSYRVAWRPDGQVLASTSSASAIMIRSLDIRSDMKAACQALSRNLTQNEWRRYMPSGTPYRRTCPNLPEGPER